jgi:hypothetical protein
MSWLVNKLGVDDVIDVVLYKKHTETSLYTVEDYGEWFLAVYEDFVLSIDFFEEFAEITFNVEI